MAVSSSSSDVIGSCDVIVIAVKPYQVLDVMDNLLKKLKSSQASGGHVPKSLRPLVVSVASSVPLAEIEKRVSGVEDMIESIKADVDVVHLAHGMTKCCSDWVLYRIWGQCGYKPIEYLGKTMIV